MPPPSAADLERALCILAPHVTESANGAVFDYLEGKLEAALAAEASRSGVVDRAAKYRTAA